MSLLDPRGNKIKKDKPPITWKIEKNGISLFEGKEEIIYMPKHIIQFIKKSETDDLISSYVLEVIPLNTFKYKDLDKRNADYNTIKTWMDKRD